MYYTIGVVSLLMFWPSMVVIFRAVFLEGYITKDITTRLGLLCNTSFGKDLPEDGHNKWLKHVGGL